MKREDLLCMVVVASVAFALGSLSTFLSSSPPQLLVLNRVEHTETAADLRQKVEQARELRHSCLREKRAIRAAYGVLYCGQPQPNGDKTLFGPTGGWCMDVSRSLDYYEEGRMRFTDFHLADAVAELVQQSGATTLYDLGGNVGLYSKRFRERGLNVTCFDGSEGVEVVTKGQVRFLDLSEPFDDFGPAEWVMSLEVGEHLPKEHQNQFMLNLVLHSTSGIILSWARPGQGGRGHFNELPLCEVVASLIAAQRATDPSHHVVLDHDATAWLSERAEFKALKTNLLVFRKLPGPQTAATMPSPCP